MPKAILYTEDGDKCSHEHMRINKSHQISR
jgi:hypothetical protein